MLDFLLGSIKGVFLAFALIVNTIFWCLPISLLALMKILIPIGSVRKLLSATMLKCAENWISVNSTGLSLAHRITWNVYGLEKLHTDRSYLVCANHQSWVDIVALQKTFNRRIPFIRFFLKDELRYIPFLGIAWWALDFPFMKRYSKSYLERHPEKRGQDLETTKKMCVRLKGAHIAILNFAEGTRFTSAKHSQQNSSYENLLSPKVGGLAFVISSMGDQFESLLDVTIFYPNGAPSLWNLLSGKLKRVDLYIEQHEIPQGLLTGNYQESPAFRKQMQDWVYDIWDRKDNLLTRLKA